MLQPENSSGILSPLQSRRSTGFALAAAAIIVLATAATVPFAKRPEPVFPPFVLMHALSIGLIQALTSYFFAIQFRAGRDPFLGALAGAFGFEALVVLLQTLVFPAVLAPDGLVHAGTQCAVWIWALWHAGFAILVLLAVALLAGGGRLRPRTRQRLGLWLIVAGPLAALTVVAGCVAIGRHLPLLIAGADYSRLRHSPVMAAFFAAILLSLAGCAWVTRFRTLLSLWLAVSLLASLADAVLTLSAPARYCLGWYAGRTLGAVSAIVVFCVLLFEFSQIYHRLVGTSETLAARALHDGLTGAFNRGFFDEQAPREVKRAYREGSALSLLLIDVDHFKTFNDRFGHQKGDACLVALVGAIRPLARRPGDVLARYGGEEFVMLLPRTDARGAAAVAAEIQAAIARLGLKREDVPQGAVTASIGMATLDPLRHHADEADLLRAADEALYEAKRGGRDAARAGRLKAQPAEAAA